VRINPDYTGITIPPNIAPLNFLVEEQGNGYLAKIYGEHGTGIELFSRSGEVVIPKGRWRELLEKNKGGEVHFDIFVLSEEGGWQLFPTVTNKVATDEIDKYLVYRKIAPAHGAWGNIGIYQRRLDSYGEKLILDNSYFAGGCLNCHTFCNNSTERMLINIRSADYGSSVLMVRDGAPEKIGTKFTYPSWHPSGRVVAYSINNIDMFYHTAKNEVRDVLDLDSLIAYWDVEGQKSKTAPAISDKQYLETYPTWSPDGKYLYFCRAPRFWGQDEQPHQHYSKIKYDLARVSYELETDSWGEVETVLSAADTGFSVLLPRISPDGRWLLFCMCDYGSFAVYQKSSDLYVLDLRRAEQTGKFEYHRLEANSEKSESWHCWSNNSRWIVFSSKRQSHTFTRPYLAYVDDEGNAEKAFVLPQKDPGFYGHYLKTFNTPEFVTEAVEFRKDELARLVRSDRAITAEMPITMATPQAPAVSGGSEYSQYRE